MKNKMKKLFALLLVLSVLTLTLCACGGHVDPGDETPGEETPGEETPGDETPGGEIAPKTADEYLAAADLALADNVYNTTASVYMEGNNEEVFRPTVQEQSFHTVTVDGDAIKYSRPLRGGIENVTYIDGVIYYELVLGSERIKRKVLPTQSEADDLYSDNYLISNIDDTDFETKALTADGGRASVVCTGIKDESFERIFGSVTAESLSAMFLGVGITKYEFKDVEMAIAMEDYRYTRVYYTYTLSVCTEEGKLCDLVVTTSTSYTYEDALGVIAPTDADAYSVSTYTQIFG